MPVPIIAAGAAAIAARLAAKKVAQAAGKQVVKATLGKKSAAKYAAQKAASNSKTAAASSRNAKKAAETRAALKSAKSKPPLATPKSNVQTKPARKQVPNPPNQAKAFYKFDSSRGRAYNKAAKEYEEGAGRHGNMYEMQDAASDAAMRAQTTRKANIAGKKLAAAERNKATTPRTSKDTTWSTKNRVKINSAKPTKGSSDNFVEVPVKDNKLGARPKVFTPRTVAARKPARKPVPNPKNPPKGTVKINSGSNRPAMLRKRAVRATPKKK